MKHEKRICSTCICVWLIILLFGITVVSAADDTYNVWVNGVEVTSENCSDVLSDGTVWYDSETRTLTLSGTEIYDYNGYLVTIDEERVYASVAAIGDLTIYQEGNNVLYAEESDDAEDLEKRGVWVSGELTLAGSGELYIGSYDEGITADSVIVEGGEVSVFCKKCGISTNETVSVRSGEVTLSGEENAVLAKKLDLSEYKDCMVTFTGAEQKATYIFSSLSKEQLEVADYVRVEPGPVVNFFVDENGLLKPEIYNRSSWWLNMQLCIARYSKNGKLIDTSVVEESVSYETLVNMEEVATPKNGEVVKAFLMDAKTHTPVSSPKTAKDHEHQLNSQIHMDGKNHWRKCTECNVMQGEAHQWGEIIELWPAEETEPGKGEQSCTVCGYTREVYLPALNFYLDCYWEEDWDDETVTDPFQQLSGYVEVAEGNEITELFVEVTNEDERDYYCRYDVALDEENEWCVDAVQLKRGENWLEVTCTDIAGVTDSFDLLLTYDPGTIASYTEEQVSFMEEDGIGGYINDVILVTVTDEANTEERDDILTQLCDTLGGTVIGGNHTIRLYQIQVQRGTIEELVELCQLAMEIPGISSACCDVLSEDQSEGQLNIPNDPWQEDVVTYRCTKCGTKYLCNELPSKDRCSDPVFEVLDLEEDLAWDEENPSGRNWWIEAVHGLSARELVPDCGDIKIGVVDTNVDWKHKDLDVREYFFSASHDAADHGTHIMGIINAISDNSIGIFGMTDGQVVSYGVKKYFKEGKLKTDSASMYEGIVTLVEEGVRVINVSQGNNYADTIKGRLLRALGKDNAKEVLERLNKITDDFIIVQAAGNNGRDALYSGIFTDLVDSEYADHIIIVANVAEPVNNSYQLYDGSSFPGCGSSFGPRVTVAAPGTNILSTVVGDGYQYLTGTSMAAPVVTAIAGMVWSVDPEFTAKEVKDIIVDTATTPVSASRSEDTGTYYLVDAYAAVREAMARKGGQGTVMGRFVNETTSDSFHVKYRVYTEEGEEVAGGVSMADGSFSLEVPSGSYLLQPYGNYGDYYIQPSYTPVTVTRNMCIDLGDIRFTLSKTPDITGYCGAEGNEQGLTWEINCGERSLTIRGQGAMKDYRLMTNDGGDVGDFSDAPWFLYSWDGFFEDFVSIDKVIIGPDVTYIGDYAFFDDNEDSPMLEVYFYGNAPAVGKAIHEGAYYFGIEDIADLKSVVFYYPEGASGWTDSAAYDRERGTWNGYIIKPWDGVNINP